MPVGRGAPRACYPVCESARVQCRVRPPQGALPRYPKGQREPATSSDTVVTSGGLIGKVTRVVDDNEVQVELADNVRARLSEPQTVAAYDLEVPAAPPGALPVATFDDEFSLDGQAWIRSRYSKVNEGIRKETLKGVF